MFSENLDISDIVYASDKNRLTKKSKIILDELAEQVAAWNREDIQLAPIKIKQYQRTSASSMNPSSTISAKRMSQSNIKDCLKDIKSGVQEKRKFFENLNIGGFKPQVNEIPKQKLVEKKLSKNLSYETNKENSDDFVLPPAPLVLLDNSFEYSNEIIPVDIIESLAGSNYDLTTVSPITSTEDLVMDSSNSVSLMDEITKGLKDMEYIPSINDSHQISSFINSSNESISSNLVDNETVFVTSPRKSVDNKPRRSLSWSENVQIINLSSSEESLTDSKDETEEFSIESSDVNFGRLTQKQEEISDYDELKFKAKVAQKQAKGAAEALNALMLDKRFGLGGSEHVAVCLKLIENTLKSKAVAERMHVASYKKYSISGKVLVGNMQFTIRAGMALIDFSDLERRGFGSHLANLSLMYHIVVFVRCKNETYVKKSAVYTIISESEAIVLGLPHSPLDRLEVFESIVFHELRPDFRLQLEVFCMTVSPKQEKSRYKRKRTPLHKMLQSSCGSVDKLYGLPPKADRTLYFTNIASFSITAVDLTENEEMFRLPIVVPQDSLFTGDVYYFSQLSLRLGTQCVGKLNIFVNTDDKGSWHHYLCHMTYTAIWGTIIKEPDTDNNSLCLLPFYLCAGEAEMCDWRICAAENAFSILINDAQSSTKMERTPQNRRISRDGKKKSRFLAQAPSEEEALFWCAQINSVKQDYRVWSCAIAGLAT